MKIGRRLYYIFTLNVLLTGVVVAAKPDSLSLKVQGVAVLSSDELVPLWIHTNQFGRIASFGKGQLIGRLNASYQHDWGSRGRLIIGADAWLANDNTEHALSQFFAQYEYGKFTVLAGKKNLDYLQDSEKEISFLNFKNIRPMPAIALGFFNYTDLPFTSGYMQFKACLLQGVLNDDRKPNGIDKPLYHFKNLYIKSNRLPVNVFAGISHSALFGGTTTGGVKIPVDWINTVLISSSDKLMDLFPNDAVNKPGEHVGLTEIGLLYENEHFQLMASVQNPCTDQSGLHTYKDKIINLSLQLKKQTLFERVQYQYGNFKYQSGPGLHLGHYRNDVEDYNLFLKENFGLETNISTWEEFYPYLTQYVNHGYPEFGRDNYFNHFIYKQTHSYNSHFFGYPLMHTSKQIAFFNDIDDFNYASIGNNRLDAHHIFIDGRFCRSLSYKARVSISHNYGTYSGYYVSGFNERENYYFHDGKKQNYLSFELQKEFPKQLACNLHLAYDYGELYNSFGLMVSFTKTILP